MKDLSGSTALLILGMHRSGTSALSGLLESGGVNLGKRLLGPQSGVNDRGFFENANVVKINEDALDEVSSQWDQPHAIGPALATLDEAKLKKRMCACIDADYAGSPIWAIKDPRCVLLEPAWSAAIRELGASLKYIAVCRHPSETADSLARRDGFSLNHALMLWMNYNLHTLEAISERDSLIITYQALIEDAPAVAARIEAELGLESFASRISEQFIEKKLQRSHTLSLHDSALGQVATDLYDAMATGTIKPEELLRIRERYATAMAPVLSTALAEHLHRVSASEVHYRHLFYDAYTSWWWNAVAPLRWLHRKSKGQAKFDAPPK